MKTGTVFALAALGVAIGVAADARTAREILDAASETNEAREPDDVRQTMKMTLVDSRGGERVRDLVLYAKSYENDREKSILFFESPPEVRGVGFLAWSYPEESDDQWLYLPALKRVRRITANGRRQSFQGSDFTYEDLELFDEMADWDEEEATSRLLREGEEIDGVPCAVIELVPKIGDYEYGRFRLWIHEDDATVRKIEFDRKKDGELVKTLTLSGFRTIDGIPTPHRLEMVNHRKETRTVMELSEVAYDQGLDDDVFTERTLKRGKVR